MKNGGANIFVASTSISFYDEEGYQRMDDCDASLCCVLSSVFGLHHQQSNALLGLGFGRFNGLAQWGWALPVAMDGKCWQILHLLFRKHERYGIFARFSKR